MHAPACRTTKKVPRSRSSLGRRAPARGTRLRSRSSQRPREACGTVYAGARPQVHWPRVSRGGRLVTEVRRRRQSSSPPRPFQRPDRSLKADWLDERSTSNGAVRERVEPCPPRWEVVWRRRTALLSRLHHPRPGIYNAVLRSDLWALPALGTGHRLGIQNAPAGGPSPVSYTHLTLPTNREV